MKTNLTQAQQERYLRQILLEEIGHEGQEKLLSSSVLIIGAGGLGSPNILYLAGAGVGTLGIVDFDTLDLSNLHRQVLHSTEYIGMKKAQSAKNRVLSLNSDVVVKTYELKLTAHNILDVICDYDVVIDATDNFASKFLINDACVLAGKPFIHSGVFKYMGQALTSIPKQTACFRCVFDKAPDPSLHSSLRGGLLGVVPAVLGCIQATEAIKYLLNIGDLLLNQLLYVDLRSMIFRKIPVAKNSGCIACGNKMALNPDDYF